MAGLFAFVTTYTVNTHGAYAPGGVVLFVMGLALTVLLIIVLMNWKK